VKTTFDGTVFCAEMKKMAHNIEKYYDTEDAWATYEHANIAIQGAWYQGLIDKETMQKSISEFVTAAMAAEQREKNESEWLYGYFYRPL
jgi:hypothetical protein